MDDLHGKRHEDAMYDLWIEVGEAVQNEDLALAIEGLQVYPKTARKMAEYPLPVDHELQESNQ